jgi:asparagine synthase (glutamine-hydrolysing)
MCGIAGVCGPGASGLSYAVERMCDNMAPRGPDDEGTIRLGRDEAGVVLGARRLAIIDPSPAGHQPFFDRVRGNAVVFNGMIYNYRELKRDLEALGETFESNCDTEVVLKCYGHYGPGCVDRLRGMFAFAIWNAQKNALFVARDRLGIKPLYYAIVDDRFVFASQVKTLLASGLISPRLCSEGVRSFLAYGAVSDPITIIDGVHAIDAGHCATWTRDELSLRRYWSPYTIPASDHKGVDLAPELRATLDNAVARHLISDAPLGIFLSGGVDSSTIASLATRHTPEVKTISVAFEEESYSEAEYQRMVAAQLGCESISVILSAADLLGHSAEVFAAMDQPSFDGFNTYAVSLATSQAGIKVALSGLGADELFDGYGYVNRIRKLEAISRLPAPGRVVAGYTIARLQRGTQGRKMRAWLGGELPPGASYELLRRLFLPSEVATLMADSWEKDATNGPRLLNMSEDLWNQVSATDLSNYIKNVLLRDTDAMSMAVSLEVRVPFLDDELVQWAFSVPGDLKKGAGKAMLVTAVRDLLPAAVADRKKQGFLLPIEEWMRGSLKDNVEATLFDPPDAVGAILETDAMRAVWREFQGGREHWLRPWALYVLCRWVRESLPSSSVSPS